MTRKNTVLTAAIASAMAPEDAVAPPPRARSSSFASQVSDLRVGDTPVSKVMDADGDSTISETLASLPVLIERHRNSVNSAIVRAKQRNPSAEYSTEVTHFVGRTTIYIVALVTRTA